MTEVDRQEEESAIPFVDLGVQHDQIAEEVEEGWRRVIAATSFILSEDVSAFESEFAAYVGVRHCLGVGNGTDAIELCLRALEVGPGDEVVIPANSFIASATAVARTGAGVRFADVSADTLLVDPHSVSEQMTSQTKVVLPVHLFGQMAPVEALLAGDAHVVEDAAQSQGASRNGHASGSRGVMAATSFYPGKNLGAYGDAGAVLTDDADLAESVRRLRNHGSVEKHVHETLGFNSRLDPIQAVVLRAKLRRLDRWNEQRGALAQNYQRLLSGLDQVTLPATAAGNVHVWHLYVVRVPDRDTVVKKMQAAGVAVQIHYPTALHLGGPFRDTGYARGDLPVAEAAADEIVSLPLYPGMTSGQQERVAAALEEALG